MSDFRIRRRRERNGLALVLEGSVDGPELAKLIRLIDGIEGPVTVDFLHVRDIPDRVVGALAELQRRRVSLRGLSEHQEKMLRYLSAPVRANFRGAGSAL
jgi:hypothetical protein